jgi:hypothetical protein
MTDKKEAAKEQKTETAEEPTEKRTAAKAEEKEPKAGLVQFHVPGHQTRFAFGKKIYPVKNHKVDLPAGETWYAPLIENGTLTQEE